MQKGHDVWWLGYTVVPQFFKYIKIISLNKDSIKICGLLRHISER